MQHTEFFSVERLKHNLKHYFANTALVWLVILFYRYNNYYSGFMRSDTQQVFLYLALAYTVFGLTFHLTAPAERIRANKGIIVFGAAKKAAACAAIFFKRLVLKAKLPFPKLEKTEKTTLLFLLVKLFFAPLMVNFAFDNYFAIKGNLAIIGGQGGIFSVAGFNSLLFPLMLAAIFFADTLYFSFGYVFEAGFLKNKIRSVEPTIFGWAVALICYPPFNSFYGRYIPWYPSETADFGNDATTFFIRIAITLLLLVYLGATLALGAKCSNLTNRGIVTRGPYAIIRHPAYICKNLGWWLTIIPVMSLGAFLSMLSWSAIYFFRAITEERHLMKDPDYQAYCKKVKYRFIPHVW